MADENIVTNIVANADFSGLIADVNKVTASLSKLQGQLIASDAKLANQVAVMNRSFSENLRRTGQFSTHFVTLTSDVEKFGKNLDGGKLKLRDYFRTFQEHTKTSGGIIRDLAKQQVALQNAIIQPLGKNAQGLMQFNVQVPQGLDKIKNKTALARQELQILNKVVQDGGVQLINWGKNTQWAGRQLTVGLTVPLAAFGKAAADAFRMADAELTRLTKVYGGVAATSAAELSKIRDEVSSTAAEIARGYGISFKETIALAADIAATGKTGNDLLASVKETSRLAVLGEVDRQDAMKATLAIQTTFKQNTEELAESINFLNSVENQTSTSLADLVEAIPKAGPVMQGLGGDVKDLALYLTAMKEGGINASEGANALKSALASLINPTKVAKEKFSAMGIDLGGIVTQNAGNLTGTIMALQSALDNLDPLQKQQAIEQLFGKFQFARLNALFANLGKQGSQTLQVMDLMKASSQELASVAGRELSMVTESASGKYNRAVEGLKADLAGIGEEFLKVQTFFINVIDGIVNFTTSLPKPIKQILTFAGGLTAIIGPVIMLTGVLANFFGYVIKGVSHFKALFKGGEGWKMLTPEILAAQKAGSLVEQTFYSDAQAATVLKTAIEGLISEFNILQSKAQAGAISVAPALKNFVNGATGRVVNPNHPMLSPTDTRSMSHMNPVGGMTADQKAGQTIFGVVPGAPRVNQAIGNNPQIYSNAELPEVQGLTRIGKASTGVVASEAAKWHAMTGALAMQSDAEIKALKLEVGRTGLITHELSASYQALLPEMTKLTQKAAAESAEIVAELQASKITVDQARAKIIALNAQIEAAMGAAATDIAGQQGRSIALNSVPLLSQPVVDKAGKSNMKELARPGRTRGLLNKIAGGLGVKTFGAPYSIETTMPKKFATGNLVPGSGNSDTVPALLTPGEFVINKKATAENLPLLEAINGGNNTEGIGRNGGGGIQAFLKMAQNGAQRPMLSKSLIDRLYPGRLTSRANAEYYEPKGNAGIFGGDVSNRKVSASTSKINKDMEGDGVDPTTLLASINARGGGSRLSTDVFLDGLVGSGIITKAEKRRLSKLVFNSYAQKLMGMGKVNDANNPVHSVSESLLRRELANNPTAIAAWDKWSRSPGSFAHPTRRSSTGFLNQIQVGGQTIKFANLEASKSNKFYHAKEASNPFIQTVSAMMNGRNPNAAKFPNEFLTPAHGKSFVGMPLVRRGNSFGRLMDTINTLNANTPKPFLPRGTYTPGAYKGFNRRNKGGIIGLNAGGMVPRYQDGGFVSGYREQTSKGYLGKGMMSRPEGGGLGMGAQMGIMMGGSMAGQQVGGNAGMALTAAANILPWLPFQKILPLLKSGEKGAGALKNALTLAGKAAGLLTRMLPGAAVIGAITLAVKGYQAWQKQIAETRREHIMLNGITEKGAQELGINYKNVSTSIKDVQEQLKLQKDTTKAAFEAYASSGVPGLTLSIKQLKDLKQQVKTTMPEIVGTFNSVDASKVNDLAINLKAQMISSGKSVEEATNTIYALVSASDKASQALGAISQKGFAQIVDKSSAAQFSIGLLVKNLDNVNRIDPEAFSSNIDSVIASLDNAVTSLTGTKDATGATITEAKALAIEFEKMAKSGALNKQLSGDALVALQKQRPELAAILNKADTIGSMYAKWRLTLQGTAVDLQNISAQQAIGLAAYQEALNTAADAAKTNTDSATFGKSASALKDLNARILANQKLQKSASDQTAGLDKAGIKRLQDKIKLINEEAEAKKRALQITQDAANTELELQKLQLEAQSALARGDRDAYEAANIAIAQMTKEAQTKAALDKIEENRLKAVKAQQDILDADQAKKDSTTSKAGNVGSTISADQASASAITSFQNRLGDLMVKQANVDKMRSSTQAQKDAKAKAQESVDQALLVVLKDLEKTNKDVQKAFPEYIENGKAKDISSAKTVQMKRSGNTIVMPPGEGRSAFTSGASAISKEAEAAFKGMSSAITGGATLKMVMDAINGKSSGIMIGVDDKKGTINQGRSFGQTLKDFNLDAASLNKSDAGRRLINNIIETQKLQKGDKFELGGYQYNVTTGYDKKFSLGGGNAVSAGPVKRALGGYAAAGQTYGVNDRINSLGAQQEGFMPFTPKVSGMIYPNADTMPRYNIASGEVTGMRGGVNSSYNNNTYSINIALNGTNVTADDVMRRFKSEMALVHAKEGRPKTVGGMI
jgi:TP901 family phage tail tape measure protein